MIMGDFMKKVDTLINRLGKRTIKQQVHIYHNGYRDNISIEESKIKGKIKANDIVINIRAR